MKGPIDAELQSRVMKTLLSCQNDDGGFGGGSGQESHLATTYAAVNSLAILQCEEAYQQINRFYYA